MTNEPKSAGRKPRRLLRWLGIIVGGLLLLLVVAWFVGTSEWALKSIILPKAGEAMNAKITVQSADLSPFSAVTLRGLKVETKGPDPLLTAETVRTKYSLRDIIKGHINIDEVVLESPVVNVITFPDGTSNLDPLTEEKAPKEKKEDDRDKQPGEPARLNLKKFILNNATVRKIDLRADGTRELLELTGVVITADDIGNNKTGQIALAANLRLDQGLKSASNGVLAAAAAGRFNLTLDPNLKPQVVKGQTTVNVSQAAGAFKEAAGLGVVLNADLTPARLNDVSVRLAQAGTNLGALTVSGPFSAETMEGKLAIVLSQIDRAALNLAGAAMGIDFNRTTISSTNTVELTQRGRIIAVNGQLLVGSFSATTQGQTTPTLDVRSAYALTYDQTNRTAEVQALTLHGTQNNAEFLRGTLSAPMTLNLAGAADAPDSSFDLVVTNFNLPDWRAFLGTNVDLASGRVGANARLLSRAGGQDLSVTGTARVQDLTGTVASNRFDRFGTSVDLDVSMRGPAVEIRKLAGTLQQSGQAGGAFEVTGNYHLSNQIGQVTAKLAGLNQHALKSFLAAALGDRQLESITVNATTTAQLGGPDSMTVTSAVQVANLVVNDPTGQVPKTALALEAVVDVSKTKEVIDLRTVQLALTKTERAPNSLNIAGRIDMTQSNAWTGNLKVTSDGLDVTPYYELLAKKDSDGQTPGQDRAPAPPKTGEAKPDTEPEPVTLPFSQFVQEVDIAKFFLREIAISNLVAKTTISNGRITVDPASLTLNGGAVSLKALLNLAVAGYEYNVAAKLSDVPIEPVANTFVPEKKGFYKGTLLTAAEIKGAGVTGPNLTKNLAGELGLTLTNADIKVLDNPRLQKLLRPIALAIRVPELANSPLSWVDARAVISNGTIHLPAGTAESSVFRAQVGGTITMANVLSNSTLNRLPVDLALSRNVAQRARLAPSDLATNVQFVALPRFVSVGGTMGDPKPQIDSVAVGRILLGTAGNFVDGDAGRILRGLGNLGAGGTNQAGTNATSTNAVGNLLRSVGGLLQGDKTNTTNTNAPGQRRDRFNPLDLLK